MNYDNKLLQNLIGKSISSIVLHYYTTDDFESLDWITFTIESKQYTFSTGKFAEDITIEPNYSLPQIEKWLKDLYEGFKNKPWVVSKEYNVSKLENSFIEKILLLEKKNFEYANLVIIKLNNAQSVSLMGGADCIYIDSHNSILEIE